MRCRRRISGRVKDTHRRHIGGFCGCNQHFFGARWGGCNITRHPFLQQQFDPLDHRLGMKPVPHPPLLQRICKGRDRHALVMRHKAAHDGEVLLFLQAGGRKIDCLIKPISPLGAQRRQPRIVLFGSTGINHRSQRRGIGCDHPVLAEPAFQAKPRHPEIGILISHFQITGVVRGFRYPPWHTKSCAIALLARNNQPVCLLQYRSRRCPHHQRWHQIFKHAARPGYQRRARTDRSGRAPQPEPVPRINIALGDGKQAGQPRLGCQKIIAVRVNPIGDQRKSDGQKLFIRLQQKAKLHFHGKSPRRFFDFAQQSRVCRMR